VDFTATVINDAWEDGDREVNVTAVTAGLNVAMADSVITVRDDDGDSAPTLVVNEIFPQAEFGSPDADANLDGFLPSAGDNSDTFVELVNVGTEAIDISGFSLQNRGFTNYTFPLETIVEPTCAVVVFSHIDEEGFLPGFGGALVLSAGERGAGDRRDEVTYK
ncbi:lamin tail domain-containing protein, partial [Verrucomicrobiales bacterium]|nr:lamin tail domain-containing protein [Verrucomicrobiales bacterium]